MKYLGTHAPFDRCVGMRQVSRRMEVFCWTAEIVRRGHAICRAFTFVKLSSETTGFSSTLSLKLVWPLFHGKLQSTSFICLRLCVVCGCGGLFPKRVFSRGGSRQEEFQQVLLVKFWVWFFQQRCQLPLFCVVLGCDCKRTTASIYDIVSSR